MSRVDALGVVAIDLGERLEALESSIVVESAHPVATANDGWERLVLSSRYKVGERPTMTVAIYIFFLSTRSCRDQGSAAVSS